MIAHRYLSLICKSVKIRENHIGFCQSQRRYVGIFKKPLEIEVPTEQENHLKEICLNNQSLSIDAWTKLRFKMLTGEKGLTSINIDAAIIGYCMPNGNINVARSYIEFLKQCGTQPNIATIGKYLKLFYTASGAQSITDCDKTEILSLYERLISLGPLDATTCENLIHALSLTDQWERSLDLLQMIKLTAKPSCAAYSIIATKAFEEAEYNLAWELLKEMIAYNHIPKCSVLVAFIQIAHKKSRNQAIDDINTLLKFISTHEINISKTVAVSLMQFFESVDLQCKMTTIKPSGNCNACTKKLNCISLHKDDFNWLKTNFLQRVLIRENVYNKTTPAEIERFEEFFKLKGPFDCIIDGLNVAFCTGGKKPLSGAKSIASVVSYFNKRNKKTLVLGRSHMLKWPKTPMNYIRSNAALFLTEDLSQDDPYLLYAALKSGPHTDICSKDMMRGHAHLLGPEFKPIFRRWQHEHQYTFEKINEFYDIAVREPIKYNTSAHEIDGFWHIPFTDEYLPNPDESFQMEKSTKNKDKISVEEPPIVVNENDGQEEIEPKMHRGKRAKRTSIISEPYKRVYINLVDEYQKVFEPKRTAMLKRKLDNMNRKTLEQLEEIVSVKKVANKKDFHLKSNAAKQTANTECEYLKNCLDTLVKEIAKRHVPKVIKKKIPDPATLTPNQQKLLNCAWWNINNVTTAKTKAPPNEMEKSIQRKLALVFAKFVDDMLKSATTSK